MKRKPKDNGPDSQIDFGSVAVGMMLATLLAAMLCGGYMVVDSIVGSMVYSKIKQECVK